MSRQLQRIVKLHRAVDGKWAQLMVPQIVIQPEQTTTLFDNSLVVMDDELFAVQSPSKAWSASSPLTGAVRLELRAGDRWAGDAAKSDYRQRCEIGAKTKVLLNTELWGAFSSKLSGAMPATPSIFFQMHQRPESGEEAGKPPALSFSTGSGNMNVTVRGDLNPSTTSDPINTLVYQQPYVANIVHDFVIRARFGWGNGELDVWDNGQHIVSQTDLIMGYNDQEPDSRPTMKLGLYRQSASETVVHEIANVAFFRSRPLTGRVSTSPQWPLS